MEEFREVCLEFEEICKTEREINEERRKAEKETGQENIINKISEHLNAQQDANEQSIRADQEKIMILFSVNQLVEKCPVSI